MNWKNLMLGTMATVLMAACGGGGGGSNANSPAYNVSGNSAFGNGSSGSSGGSGSGSGSTGTTNVTSNTSGSIVLSLTSNAISASQPAIVTAVVKDASGAPVAGTVVQFALSLPGGVSATGLATVTPLAAITDANGQAATTLTPGSGVTSGAAYLTAQADTTSGSVTAKQAFSIAGTNVTLSSVAASPSSIAGYNSALINIAVSGASSTTPVTVNISSTCASNGKANISPASLTLTSSGGSVAYQDKGCGSTSGSTTDRISVQVVGTTQQLSTDLTVAAPTTQGIQFVSADPTTICEKGTGCPNVANVVFKVVDQAGAPQAGLPVDFSLNMSTYIATLGAASGVTGADGTVSVSVIANRTPSPVRVIAKVRNTSLQTVSNNLTISGGLPVAGNYPSDNGMSFSVSKTALDYEYDSDYADLTLRVTDRWGAPAVDNTVINLVSDGGTVIPSYCMTTNGYCSGAVRLVVSNPKPASGRVHVVAYANGQEYFVDSNGNGAYDNGEPFDDVPGAVCIDKYENGVFDNSEFIVGNINSLTGQAECTLGDGVWDDGGSVFARIQRTFFFSYTSVQPRLYKVSGGSCTSKPVDDTYMSIVMNGQTSATLQFCVRDGNANADVPYGGNPLPSGSTISAAPSMTNAKVSIDNQPIVLGVTGPTLHTLTVTNASASNTPLSSGTATITFGFMAPGAAQPTTSQSSPVPIVSTQKVFISP